MATRNSKHAEEESVVFAAFLEAHPTFTARVASWEQPDAEFPDVSVTLDDGREIDFELGEWLHGEQMAQAKRRERLVEAIEDAIGSQGENASDYFRSVMLVPRPEFPRFDPAEAGRFREEMWELVGETERRWPAERFWSSPQGRHVRTFDACPTLGKYLSRIVFEPLVVAGARREKVPSGLPWTFVELPGGSYSPKTALAALGKILSTKIEHYGGLATPVRLLIHYGRAVAYNTPWFGGEFREFRDVAEAAAQLVDGQSSFEKIYLLSALEPGLKAYEIFPHLLECN